MSSHLSNTLAERALLASVFASPEVVVDVSELVDSTEFFEPRNELIYATILRLHERGSDFSPTSVVGDLQREGLLQQAGDVSYFRELLDPRDFASGGGDPIGYALLIKEAARKRELVSAGETIREAAANGAGLTADDALAVAEEAVISIVNKASSSDSMQSVAELLDEVIVDIESAADLPEGAITGIPSGFPQLDAMTGGFHGGQMIIIAARPAVGKSTLAVDFARNAVFLAGKTVMFFSLEMGSKELVGRILSAEALVEKSKIRSGQLSKEDWMKVSEAKAKLASGTFLIDANPKATVSRIRSVATRQKLRPEGLDMICIDYLQLMEAGNGGSKYANRETVVSEMSRGIKLLAKELDVPIIILSQLNRKAEERADGKPLVSDLRESGSLEQDADMVFLIHRPEAFDSNTRPGEADLILGKHRGGATGIIPLTSMLAFSKFSSGTGTIPREPEMLSDGASGIFATTEEETPW